LFLVNANQSITQNLIRGGLTCGEGSNNSIIEGNFLDGIWCGLVNGLIIRNNIIDGGGIGFAESGNQVFNNTIRNSHHGIYFWNNGYNNKIFHNNFINNTQQVGLYPDPNAKYTNIWAADSILGGNYWDDYNGSDINKDGIGDTPYVIDDNNKDNYPLMLPVTISISASFLYGLSQTETVNTNLLASSPAVPEFPAIVVLSFFVIISLITILVKKRIYPKTYR
jgi:parallel beta-helix repeat protein